MAIAGYDLGPSFRWDDGGGLQPSSIFPTPLQYQLVIPANAGIQVV